MASSIVLHRYPGIHSLIMHTNATQHTRGIHAAYVWHTLRHTRSIRAAYFQRKRFKVSSVTQGIGRQPFKLGIQAL